ncbi:hypothetical protein HF086_018307 [Spodoptera exigua]|uniref:tRNA (guanine(10)-N2)-methyltransferase homolog n=1 Tax=Spodoptera exigua TaxID=7107 RepID=A0A922M0M3_SPOEX|nr:hypothetical protein HF086_018307 [Spodoptera exigua]
MQIESKMWRRYLMWFAHEHIDFRHAEMQSIISLLNIPIRYVEKPCVQKPYCIVELPSEDCVRKIASRSVLLKNCIELWARAKTVSQLHVNLKNSLKNSTGSWVAGEKDNDGVSSTCLCPKELIESSCPLKKSFKIEVETFCKHFSMQEKVSKIETFSYLPLEGPVKLKNPDVTLAYLEFYGVDPNDVPEEPYDVFFGKWIADGQRDLIQVHSLKKRQFIGNTSMDAQLAIIMANQAQVKLGDMVLDPFVGSGSLLVAAAHFGAYVWGSDIDYMMLHARTRPTRVGQKIRTKEESIRGNMRQYGTESRYLDVVVSDFSLHNWRSDLKFDAIITDRIERDNYTLSEEHMVNHVPSKVEYGLGHIYSDLLNFAATHLEMGRRLESQLPSHPCLKLVANSEQVLSKLAARRLLTYEKVLDDVPNMPLDPNAGVHNFRKCRVTGILFICREKYFTMGETTRRERKEKRAEEVAAYLARKMETTKYNDLM